MICRQAETRRGSGAETAGAAQPLGRGDVLWPTTGIQWMPGRDVDRVVLFPAYAPRPWV